MIYQTKNLFFLFISILILAVTSCKKACIDGEGDITTKTLDLNSFTGIDISGSHQVMVIQGDTQEVKAVGHGNIIDKIKTNVSNNIWDIDFENGCYDNYQLTIFITVPDINKIDISGSGTVDIQDFKNPQNLDINISGSGIITLERVDSLNNLDIDISGSGNVQVSSIGSVDKSKINISGSGSYSGYLYKINQCYIDISGSGECKVYVFDKLNANISGSGSIYYKGNPSIVQSISGSGKVVNQN